MPKIETRIDNQSEKFKSNYKYHKSLADNLQSLLEKIREMGPPHLIEKHRKRGKLTARKRIAILKDDDSEFLEFSELSAHEFVESRAIKKISNLFIINILGYKYEGTMKSIVILKLNPLLY